MPVVKDTQTCKTLLLPLYAGILSALGALCIKVGSQKINSMLAHCGVDVIHKTTGVSAGFYILSILFVSTGVLLNAFLVKFIILSLKANGASVTIAVQFVSNYILSIFLNWAVFFDFPTWQQFVGSALIFVGVCFIAFENVFSKKKKRRERIESHRDELPSLSPQEVS